MIYLNKEAVKELDLKKGDIVKFTMEKIGFEEPRKNEKAHFQKTEETVTETEELSEAEKTFLKQYNSANEKDNPTMASYYKKEAEKQFGEDRVKRLLEDDR